ncbi:MAG: hypothetical protein N2606_06205 [Candidatus Omnitrophica bacterium]|nr:hypothetical protein [Candidatus Omnitrophota bacterium]
MSSFITQYQHLKLISSFVKKKFRHFGVNKKQEIIRLVYEICKRENLKPQTVLKDLPVGEFHALKDYLVCRRFPIAYAHNQTRTLHLPKLKLDKSKIFAASSKDFYPRKIIVEKRVRDSVLTKKFTSYFPDAKLKEIDTLKSFIKKYRCLKAFDYNHRTDTVIIIHQPADFFKRCPCTKYAVGCNYNIFNLSFGCIFECTYCFLQEYTNSPGILFPANLDSFFEAFKNYVGNFKRLGSGEFSDSLMLDNVTEYSQEIIAFFKKYPSVLFEFKTKSCQINNLLSARHKGNIVVGWSFNPECIIKENEFYTASLQQRLIAAQKCVQADYKIACHFDPIIYFQDWRKEYENLIEKIFNYLKPKDIAWISLGTLRFNPALKTIIETRFPLNRILDAELVYGYDRKLRYPDVLRRDIYQYMIRLLKKHNKNIPVYLCMENVNMWRLVGLSLPQQII